MPVVNVSFKIILLPEIISETSSEEVWVDEYDDNSYNDYYEPDYEDYYEDDYYYEDNEAQDGDDCVEDGLFW